MGNKVSVEKSGSRRSGNHRWAPTHLYDNNLFRTEVEQEACKFVCESAQCEQVEEQRFRYPELQASWAHGEKQRNAEEARDMRQRREEELKAIREQDRQLEEQRRIDLEIQEKRAREEQRKANEDASINRQQLEQKLNAMRERERQRQEKIVAPSLCLSLPGVCRYHNTSKGCTDPNCRRLHICRQLLADICNYGVSCRFGHSLTTAHNQGICSTYNMDTTRELVMVQQLRRAFEESDELTKTMLVNSLQICYKAYSKGCDWYRCNRIHICRQFVAGRCERTDCKFGHDLHATHNNGVLRRHRMTKMSDVEILDVLCQREKRRTQRVNGAASVSSSAKNGAIYRNKPSSDGAAVVSSAAKNGAISRNKPSSDGAAAVSSSAKNGAIPRNKPSSDGGKLSKPSKPSQSSQLRDGVSEELQCPVCLEMFRRATTLGCGHTFCADCLQQVRDKNVEKCPLCCAPISSFIRSVALDNIIRSMAAKQ